MKPIIRITVVLQEEEKASYMEKTILLFDMPIYKRTEAYAGDRKDKAVGFTDFGTSLTKVEDYEEEE